MRKTKPFVIGHAGRISVFGSRKAVRPLDNGVMAVPISSDQRSDADEEMKDFIGRHNQRVQSTHK